MSQVVKSSKSTFSPLLSRLLGSISALPKSFPLSIPPLEALSLGAPVAVANASCLPELYGDTVRYFDPYDYEVDLDALFARPVAPPDTVLKTYSWPATAAFWLEEIRRFAAE